MGSIRCKMFSGVGRFLIREETRVTGEKHPAVTDPGACIFSLGFLQITSPGQQIFYQVATFWQMAILASVQTYTNHISWVCKSVAPGKPQTGRVKLKLSPGTV